MCGFCHGSGGMVGETGGGMGGRKTAGILPPKGGPQNDVRLKCECRITFGRFSGFRPEVADSKWLKM
jgi:hypothetical protein